ncbi:MAG: histidine phosphatase family protein [Rhabdochlamydiaceae bacterium]
MQTHIYLVRHGEVYNPEGIIYGRLPNYGLSQKGKEELEQTADFLKDKNVSQLFSSPLLRARQSADIIKTGLGIREVHISNLLYETLTAYEGKKFDSLYHLQSEVYLKPLSPKDETIEQLAVRMEEFLDHVIAEFKGERIVAVGHGDPIMAIKAVIKKRPLDFMSFKTDQYIRHGEVLEITSDGGEHTIREVFKP